MPTYKTLDGTHLAEKKLDTFGHAVRPGPLNCRLRGIDPHDLTPLLRQEPGVSAVATAQIQNSPGWGLFEQAR